MASSSKERNGWVARCYRENQPTRILGKSICEESSGASGRRSRRALHGPGGMVVASSSEKAERQPQSVVQRYMWGAEIQG